MLNVPRALISKDAPRVLSGFAKLKLCGKHPALKALAYFGNRLQALGYPFTKRDRDIYDQARKALQFPGYFICPNCGKHARFLPISPKTKLKAWFCDCSYDRTHNNGCTSGD